MTTKKRTILCAGATCDFCTEYMSVFTSKLNCCFHRGGLVQVCIGKVRGRIENFDCNPNIQPLLFGL